MSSQSSKVANLRLVGARGSGKTAYIASLAYLTQGPNRNLKSPIESIVSVGIDDDNQDLLNKAQNILEQGLQLEQTKKLYLSEVRNYSLQIALKDPSFFGSQSIDLLINCKDYSGEVFTDLINNQSDSLLDKYIDDCKAASGILLLIDGTSHLQDGFYAQGLKNFFIALDRAAQEYELKQIACTLSKCELPELWVNRHDPKGILTRRFPLMKRQLEVWADKPNRFVDYFATSAFGVIGKEYPKANTKIVETTDGGTSCIIAKSEKWRPFGLVSSIYWLSTGKRHRTLDQD